VVRVEGRNLVLLPTGGRHASPAHALSSPRFKGLFAELAKTVDVAIIDAPAVKPGADANLLMPLVDGVFLVAADRQTRSRWLSEARAQLGESRVLGALYNHLPRARHRELARERKQRLAAAG
jgi:Mrp family chromosome partitioning ATPase